MKSLRLKRAILSSYILFLILLGCSLWRFGSEGTLLLFTFPFRWFAHAYLSTTPTHAEPHLAMVNTPFNKSSDISISLYNGGYPHDLGIRLGGDDFQHAARLPYFNLAVNSNDSGQACDALERFFTASNFNGKISNVWIFDHGRVADPKLGGVSIESRLYELLAQYQPHEAPLNLYFFECEIARGSKGKRFIQELANKYRIRIYASEASVSWHVWQTLQRTIPQQERNFDFITSDWFLAVPDGSEPQRLKEQPRLP